MEQVGWSDRLGRVGAWAGVTAIDAAAAVEIEALGYGTVWQGGSPRADLRRAEELLDATESLHVATGVVNIWKADAGELADAYHRVADRHPGRLLLGIGSGHREATPHRERPLRAMQRYLDVLDARGVPVGDRLVSALGPKMLAIAAERSAGTHPYLTVPSQTAGMRAVLGAGVLVAPEQTVVLDEDDDGARSAARAFLHRYLQLSNYADTMRRAGFGDADLADGGSDALVDRIIVHGSAAAVARGIRAHLEAGADHVCVQVVPGDGALAGLAVLAGELEDELRTAGAVDH
ncbi:TIGR03620 family F420-dependent LLM class oxidoreductase [Agromyces sp. SYSU T00194]|uniref:TIGR03620 family F420-dependent LLM class oxidoreductase n=1 Tax=Agromyces chitinivorans TaxID=3158560 RepID=UPI003392752F